MKSWVEMQNRRVFVNFMNSARAGGLLVFITMTCRLLQSSANAHAVFHTPNNYLHPQDRSQTPITTLSHIPAFHSFNPPPHLALLSTYTLEHHQKRPQSYNQHTLISLYRLPQITSLPPPLSSAKS